MAVRRPSSGPAYRCPVCGAVGLGYDCASCIKKAKERAAKFVRKPTHDLIRMLADDPRRK